MESIGFQLRRGKPPETLWHMSVVQGKFELAPGAVEMIEEQVASLADVQWTVWEDRLAGRVWVTGYFNSRDEAEAGCRRFVASIKPEWMTREADWRELADADWADLLLVRRTAKG